MAGISTCLWFKSEALDAAKFYVSLRPHSAIDHIQYGVTDTLAGKSGDVLAVRFTLDGASFLALNGNHGAPFTHAVSLMIDCQDQAEIDAMWAALSDGGTPGVCGWLQDRYGVSWQVVPAQWASLFAGEQPRAARVMQAMMSMTKLDLAALQAAYDG